MLRRQSALLPKLKRIQGPAWILFAGTFVNKLGNFLSIFLLLFLTGEGVSIGKAGLAVGLIGLGNVVGNAIGGTMADRIGRRITIVISMAGSGAGTLCVPYVSRFLLLCFVVTAVGVFAQLSRPAVGATLLDLSLPEDRVTTYVIYRLSINLGMAAGPVIGGYLSSYSYTAIFWVDACTSFAYALIALRFLPETTPHEPRTQRSTTRTRPQSIFRLRSSANGEEGAPGALRTILRNRGFVVFLAALTIEALVYAQTSATLPVHIRDAGLSVNVYGWALGLNALIVILFELPLNHLAERFAASSVVSAGLFLITTGVAATAFAGTAVYVLLTACVWTVGEMLWAPTAESIPGSFDTPALRGRYQGAWGLAFSAGVMLGPVVGSILYGVNPAVLWAGMAVLGYTATALSFGAVSSIRPRPAGAEVPSLSGASSLTESA